MAEAMHADPMARAGARINLEAELAEMVASGRLKVRDSLTRGPHPYPVGAALKDAVLLPQEVRRLLAERGVSLPDVAAPAPTHAPSASASPAARPEAVAVPAGAVPMAEAEGAEKRQDRRLAELRSMGADFVPHGKGWRVDRRRGALADLIRREAGKPMGTKDGVRKDLSAAVQREMKRNGRVSR